MVLVIIILLAWVVVLGPSFLKRRARSGGDQSITHFHHQLRILEHSAPEPLVTPAYRLRAVDGSGAPTGVTYPGSMRPKLTVVGARELPRPALAFLGEPAPGPAEARVAGVGVAETGVAGEPGPAGAAPFEAGDRAWRTGADVGDVHHDGEVPAGRPRPPRALWTGATPPPVEVDGGPPAESFARQQARRRRRDTFSVLAVVFAATLLLGAVTGATAVWALCALDAVALAAYVALLVHLRRLAVERERKLHYLDGSATAHPGDARSLSTRVSGRYAHPSSQQAIAR